MSSRHLTMRLDEETFERLDAQRQRLGQTRSELGRTLIEEGLRMQDYPGIAFRSGPGGRRAGLAGGPDVWEVVRAFTTPASDAASVSQDASPTSGEEALRQTAELCGLSVEQVQLALRYYAEFRDEIDAWIRRVDEEAERAEAAWRREQLLLQR